MWMEHLEERPARPAWTVIWRRLKLGKLILQLGDPISQPESRLSGHRIL